MPLQRQYKLVTGEMGEIGEGDQEDTYPEEHGVM